VLLLWIADRKPSTRAALVCLSCSVAWGFGFCHTGLWARPRLCALGGALVMPRKIWPGPVLPPPKFPGVAMESCLVLAVGVGVLVTSMHTTYNNLATADSLATRQVPYHQLGAGLAALWLAGWAKNLRLLLLRLSSLVLRLARGHHPSCT
jgi:hypothetical protein